MTLALGNDSEIGGNDELELDDDDELELEDELDDDDELKLEESSLVVPIAVSRYSLIMPSINSKL
jgi:hypothetical protein